MIHSNTTTAPNPRLTLDDEPHVDLASYELGWRHCYEAFLDLLAPDERATLLQQVTTAKE